ncbi:MAG: two-component system response regulator NarL [Pseudomonadales bacterium]|nr:two-component system response regulator NarL [Pseudomonadales bacterium]
MVTEASKIMLVDDHPLLRRGIQQLVELEDDLDVIAQASSGEHALELLESLDPDLILLDLNMKGMDGLETLRAMREQGVVARIVVFTVSDDSNDVVAALKSGADGYLLKDMDPDELMIQLREACQGKMVLSDSLTELLALSYREDSISASTDIYNRLTRREKEILKMIADGLSNKMIGRQLDIVEATVKVHVKNLLKKLGLRSRVEAAVWMVKHKEK